MNLEKKLLLSNSNIFIAIITILFYILSNLYAENLLLRILSQVCQSMFILFICIRVYIDRKRKLLGYFLIGIFVLSLYSVMTTISIGL